jgi:hypothetical protein
MQPNQNNEKIGFNAMHAEELGSSLTNWLDEEEDQVAMEMKRQSAQMSTTAIANNGSATWDRNVVTYLPPQSEEFSKDMYHSYCACANTLVALPCK